MLIAFMLPTCSICIIAQYTTDASTSQSSPSSNKDLTELPQGPITRARAKLFKEAISALVTRISDETMTRHNEKSQISSTRTPCNLLQVDLSFLSAPRASLSSTQLVLAHLSSSLFLSSSFTLLME
ncbi:hypothetical protein J1N35_037479 [Gossypium stocksii]|uniref:Uncharacterized protein n=1 Tax=Gossypium stocksii TaxID=47602 RepID=A0A9D3UKL8_9ROSI|nr:hypothetical protein J1N35_037479 [Gossypium stocksii]